jgi:SAM-dependent MidA family methyltransferase
MSWMAQEITKLGGAIPFDRFMELALYHPEHGYYSAARPRYGRDGDYLTAPTASEWYPRVVARLLRRLAERGGPLRLVDVAAGDGSFVAGVLEAIGPASPEVVAEIVAVERSPAMRRRLGARLDGFPFTLLEDPSAVPVGAVATVLHASELYDAQPVARAIGRDGGINELWVAAGNSGLVWQERPPREEVAAYFARHGVALEEGQIGEAGLGAATLHRLMLRAAAGPGLCLVLDYGYEARRLYDPRGRRGGSLTTFAGHRIGRDALETPGEIDLTAHVNWDDLRHAGAAEGWTELGLWPLAELLVRAGLAAELEARNLGMEAELDAATVSARQEIKRLLDPEGMGSDLKMLVQAKGDLVETASSVLSFEF